MNFFEKLKVAKEAFSGSVEEKQLPIITTWGTDFLNSIVTNGDTQDYFTSWIWACINKRSQSLASINFRLYQLKGTDVVEIDEHELLDLLYKVNPRWTRFDFLTLSWIFHDLYGNSPWVLFRDKVTGKPSEMYVANPRLMKARTDANGIPQSFEYAIGNRKLEFPAQDVIELKNVNPFNQSKGMGVIEAVRLTADMESYIKQWNKNALLNDMRPSMIMTADGTVSREQKKRLKKSIQQFYAGKDNVGKALLLESGLKAEPFIIAPKDLEFMKAREMNRDEIMSIFGISKPILGIYDDVNRASALTAEYIFARWTLTPLAQKQIEQLNEFLVPQFGDDLWLDFDPLAKEDMEQKVNEYSQAVNKWMTINEVRALEGLDPVNGGDYLYMPIGNLPTVGGQQKDAGVKYMKLMKPVSKSGLTRQKEKEIKRRILMRKDKRAKWVAKHIAKKIFDMKAKQDAPDIKIRIRLKETPQLHGEAIERFYKLRMEEETVLEGLWKSGLAKFFDAQKERFLNKVEEHYKAKDLPAEFGIDLEKELGATIEIISPLYYETLMKGAQMASQLVDKPAHFDMDFLKSWLDKVSEETGKQITDTTLEAFTQTMEEAITAGEGIGKVKDRVEEVFDFAKATRAEMIARTETARAVVEAHRSVYEHYGFKEVKWLLAPDPCPLCEDKSRMEWDVKSISGQIPVHPNCKCDYTPIVKS